MRTGRVGVGVREVFIVEYARVIWSAQRVAGVLGRRCTELVAEEGGGAGTPKAARRRARLRFWFVVLAVIEETTASRVSTNKILTGVHVGEEVNLRLK